MKERAPYKYLDYYTFEDADLFFGREEETQKMVGEILSTKLLVLFSPSGSGKTSLINAGVRPALEKLGYKTVYVRLESDPIPSVQNAVAAALALEKEKCHSERSEESLSIEQVPASKEISHPASGTRNDSDDSIQNNDLHGFFKNVTRKAGKPLVVFIDQFEEFFMVFANKQEARQQFIEQVAKIKYDDTLPVFLVLSLREDYFANLHEFREAVPSIFQNNANLRLESFTDGEARRAIVKPLRAVGARIDKGLSKTLVRDLKNGKAGIKPIKLQIVCDAVWRKKPASTAKMTFAGYEAAGRAAHILSNYVSCRLDKLPNRQQSLLARIFEALKTPDNTKRYRSFADLHATLKLDSRRLKEGLKKLVTLNLVRQEQRAGAEWYEFKHDYLVTETSQWLENRRKRLARQRLMLAALTPVMVAVLGLCAYLFYQHFTFKAGFLSAEFPSQQDEVAIFRASDDPKHPTITTGWFYEDLRGHDANKEMREKFDLGFWNHDWKILAEKLKPVKNGLALYYLGEVQAALDSLVAALKDDDDVFIPFEAASVLVKLGKSDNRVISALAAALKDNYRDSFGNYLVRSRAAVALFSLGQSDDRVISTLVAALNDKDPMFSREAAAALVKLGKSDERAISALVAALKDQQQDVRGEAATALGNLGKSDERTISALVAALNDNYRDSFGNYPVRCRAAVALFSLGQSDDRVISALAAALKGEKPYGDSFRSEAAAALVKLGQSDDRVQTDKIISALVVALKDSVSEVRGEAATALGNLGQSDDCIISALIVALKDSVHSEVRSQAATALGNLGQSDDRIISALVTALKDDEADVRSEAAGALGNLDQSDDSIISALVAALKDDEADVRSEAVDLLGNLFKPKSENELFQLLANNLSGYRTAASQALARKDSLPPALLKKNDRLRQDDRPWIRLAAWKTHDLIQTRLKSEAEARQLLHQADSVLAGAQLSVSSEQLSVASHQYEKALDILKNIIRVDSVKTAYAKFHQARCAAKLKRVVPALDDLKMAFKYNSTLRDTLQAEMAKPENDWKILEGNWYLREVLLKR